MERHFYAYRLYHGPSSHVRILLNGVPVYHCLPSTDGSAPSATVQATHLLVPGLNTFRLDVWSAPDNMTGHFELQSVHPEPKTVFRHDYPAPYEQWGKVPIPTRPCVQLGEFFAEGVVVAPPWEDAQRITHFDAAMAEELHLAAQSFHHALAMGNADKAVELLDEKTRHLEKVYPEDPSVTARAAAAAFGDGLRGTRFRPYVREELSFTPYQEGRVVHVTRTLGGHAVEGAGEGNAAYLADLWLTRKQGTWRIFR